jgi:hypothetical protein
MTGLLFFSFHSSNSVFGMESVEIAEFLLCKTASNCDWQYVREAHYAPCDEQYKGGSSPQKSAMRRRPLIPGI